MVNEEISPFEKLLFIMFQKNIKKTQKKIANAPFEPKIKKKHLSRSNNSLKRRDIYKDPLVYCDKRKILFNNDPYFLYKIVTMV